MVNNDVINLKGGKAKSDKTPQTPVAGEKRKRESPPGGHRAPHLADMKMKRSGTLAVRQTEDFTSCAPVWCAHIAALVHNVSSFFRCKGN